MEKEFETIQELIEYLVAKINKVINIPILDEKSEGILIRLILTFMLQLLSEIKKIGHHKNTPSA